MKEKGEESHSVDCGNGHFFCWECLGEAHAPVACHKYQVVRSEHEPLLTAITDQGVAVQVCEDRPRKTALLLSEGKRNEMVHYLELYSLPSMKTRPAANGWSQTPR